MFIIQIYNRNNICNVISIINMYKEHERPDVITSKGLNTNSWIIYSSHHADTQLSVSLYCKRNLQ